MTTNGRQYGFLIAAVVAVALTATALFAGPYVARHAGGFGHGGGFGPGGHLAAVLAELDLSQEQKDRAREILHAARPDLEPLLLATIESKRAVAEAIHADTFDPRAVRKAAEKAGAAEADLAVERARLVSDLQDILTPGQRQTLGEIKERFRSRFERHLALGRSLWEEHIDELIDSF